MAANDKERDERRRSALELDSSQPPDRRHRSTLAHWRQLQRVSCKYTLIFIFIYITTSLPAALAGWLADSSIECCLGASLVQGAFIELVRS